MPKKKMGQPTQFKLVLWMAIVCVCVFMEFSWETTKYGYYCNGKLSCKSNQRKILCESKLRIYNVHIDRYTYIMYKVVFIEIVLLHTENLSMNTIYYYVNISFKLYSKYFVYK